MQQGEPSLPHAHSLVRRVRRVAGLRFATQHLFLLEQLRQATVLLGTPALQKSVAHGPFHSQAQVLAKNRPWTRVRCRKTKTNHKFCNWNSSYNPKKASNQIFPP